MEEKNEVIKEKKKIQISLVLAICLIVLFLFLMIVGVIVGMILISKKLDEKLVEKAKEAQKQLEQAIENEEKLEASTNEILQQYLQQEAKDKNINETNSNEFSEGSYIFCNNNQYSLSSAKVEFDDGSFVISAGEFKINGIYEVSNENIKCSIENYSFNENEPISLIHKNWEIIFENIETKKIEVKSNNCDEETEISITLSNLFYEGASFEVNDLNN